MDGHCVTENEQKNRMEMSSIEKTVAERDFQFFLIIPPMITFVDIHPHSYFMRNAYLVTISC